MSHARMLSSSAIAYGYDLNIAALGNPELATGVPAGTELIALVDAVISREAHDIRSAHTAILSTLDAESLVDAASVFGNFEMMNRVAEGSGIPIAPQAVERMSTAIDALGIGDFLKS